MRTTFATLFVSAVVTALVTPQQGNTQQPAANTTRSYVQVVRLKPDMVNEWLELQRNEVIPAQKKAGVTGRITLATQVGNSFEYTILTPFPSWAAMDGDPPLTRALGAQGAAELNGKLRRCIMTQTSYLINRQDDIYIAPGDAKVWRVAVRRIIPGKMQDYLTFYRTEVFPAMQKAKAAGTIAGVSVATRGAGAPSGEFTVATFHPKFADLDAGDPLVPVIGREAAAAIAAKANQFSTPGQVIIRRRLPELSF
jgi:hypothetical protein